MEMEKKVKSLEKASEDEKGQVDYIERVDTVYNDIEVHVDEISASCQQS